MEERQDKKEGELSDESIKLLLETAKNEYNNEHGRIASHDSKMNIMLPMSVAYLLAIVAMEDVEAILKVTVSNVGEALLPVILLALYAIGLIFAMTAIVKMLAILLPKVYIAIDTKDFYSPIYLNSDNTKVFHLHLYQRYVDATSNNREQNNKRMKSHKWACIFMAISFFAIVLYNLVRIVVL